MDDSEDCADLRWLFNMADEQEAYAAWREHEIQRADLARVGYVGGPLDGMDEVVPGPAPSKVSGTIRLSETTVAEFLYEPHRYTAGDSVHVLAGEDGRVLLFYRGVKERNIDV